MSQDDTPDLATPQAGKVAPEAVALRAQPRPVTRLNRRTLAILAGGAVLLFGNLGDDGLGWISFTILPIGATLWAVYTHAFRRSGLTAAVASAMGWSPGQRLVFSNQTFSSGGHSSQSSHLSRVSGFVQSGFNEVAHSAKPDTQRRATSQNPPDSARESSVVAGWHEQTHTPRLQDQELARL